MNIANIKHCDIANGPGIRVSVFVSGCEHYCKECFNQEAWDFEYGHKISQDDLDYIIKSLEPNYVKGITLLGGEPLHPRNLAMVNKILSEVSNIYSDTKSVWMYTGYAWEELSPEQKAIVTSWVDVLVDGRFEINNKVLDLRFRGSTNQRIIDIRETLHRKEITLWIDNSSYYK